MKICYWIESISHERRLLLKNRGIAVEMSNVKFEKVKDSSKRIHCNRGEWGTVD